VWALCVFGIVWNLFHADGLRIVSIAVYLAMGWLVLIAVRPLFAAVPISGIVWLVSGGLFYTVGVLFFALKRIPYNHAIWHVFVMAGSVCHYTAVILYVLPARS